MGFNFDEIDELTSLQASGIISPEEELRLYQLISEEKEAYDAWRERYVLYTGETARSLNFSEKDVFKRVLENIEQNRHRRKVFIYRIGGLVAALVAGVVVTLVFILNPVVREPARKDHAFTGQGQSGASGVQLMMPGGQAIDLSATQGKVPIGNTTILNANKAMSYSVAGDPPAGWATLTVPTAKDYKIQLADGTEVWLNSATTLKFPFTFEEESREITIHGEAYIKAAADAGRPFLVHLPHGSVQVLGTEFNVNTYDSTQAKVSLVSGSVRMKAGSTSKLVKPGFEAVAVASTDAIKLQPFDQTMTLSWRKGMFLFEDMPLEEICKVLPRWFGIKAVMDNDRIAQRKYTGLLDRNKPIDQQLNYFLTSEQVKYYFDREGVLHFK